MTSRAGRTVARGRVAGCMVLAAVLWLDAGCSWQANRRATKARREAPVLQLGQSEEGVLHCGRGICSRWYKLQIDAPQRVIVESDAPADAALPDYGLSLHDAMVDELAGDRVAHRRPRRLDQQLDPGLYFVHLFALDESKVQLSYKLKASEYRKPRPPRQSRPTPSPPPPPPPAQVPVTSDVLEVERSGGEPVAVLIEAGNRQGMRRGLTGDLVDAGRVIGRIEIVDVYAEGSRAKIVGGLSAPISLDTRAVVRKPAP